MSRRREAYRRPVRLTRRGRVALHIAIVLLSSASLAAAYDYGTDLRCARLDPPPTSIPC